MSFLLKNHVLVRYRGTESEVRVPDGVRVIGEEAFCNTNVREVILPCGVTRIERDAFRGCASLERVELSDGIRRIGESAFRGCISLTEVRLPRGLSAIGDYAFFGCTSLSRVVYPEGTVRLISWGSSNVTALERIPQGELHAGGCVFLDAERLCEVVLPSTLEEIDGGFFIACTSLRSVQGLERFYDYDGGWWLRVFGYGVAFRLGFAAAEKCGWLRSAVRKNPEEAFEALLNGQAEDIPRFLAICPRLPLPMLDRFFEMAREREEPAVLALLMEFRTRLYSPRELSRIAELRTEREMGLLREDTERWRQSFRFFEEEEEGTVSIKVYLGREACVYIPREIGGLPVVGVDVAHFDRKGCIHAFYVDADHPYLSAFDGVLYSRDGETLISYPRGKREKHFCVPAGVRRIKNGAFSHVEALCSVELPEGLEEIGPNAFAGSSLERITLPDNLRAIGSSAFSRCRLRKICIPDGVTYLGDAAFSGCRDLCEVTLGARILSLAGVTFSSCTALTRLTLRRNRLRITATDFAVLPVRERTITVCWGERELLWTVTEAYTTLTVPEE